MKEITVSLIPSSQIEKAHKVRALVFQEEQGIDAQADLDGEDDKALQFIASNGETPIGTARVRFPESPNKAKVERVAVLREYRGKGIGAQIMDCIKQELIKRGVEKVYLDSQQSAANFYSKLGYQIEGDVYEEVGIPHVTMVKQLI